MILFSLKTSKSNYEWKLKEKKDSVIEDGGQHTDLVIYENGNKRESGKNKINGHMVKIKGFYDILWLGVLPVTQAQYPAGLDVTVAAEKGTGSLQVCREKKAWKPRLWTYQEHIFREHSPGLS